MKKSEPKMILNISLNSEEIEEKVKIAMDEYVEKVIYKNLDEEMAKRIVSSPNFDCADYCDSFSDGCAFRCNRKERELAVTLKWLQSESE